MSPVIASADIDRSTPSVPVARRSVERAGAGERRGARSRRRGEYDHYEPLFRQLSHLPEDDARCLELRERLIEAHLPVAEHIARLYRDRGEPGQDLVQVARIGLINAIDRYRPEYGRGFLAFAVPTIRGEIQRHFRDATWGMRVPRRLKELQAQVSRAANELSEQQGRSPRPSELAEHLGLSINEVYDALHTASAYRPDSLNRAIKHDDQTTEQGELLGDLDEQFDSVEDAAVLRPAMQALPERERRIVALRFFHEMTQSQIARTIGISQMHVSRLLSKSLMQMRDHLTETSAGT